MYSGYLLGISPLVPIQQACPKVEQVMLGKVTRHLTARFQPAPTLIKQRIEKLIEREHLGGKAEDVYAHNVMGLNSVKVSENSDFHRYH